MQTATIDLPTLRAIAAFASKDETRYYLKGVKLTADANGSEYVGTDGRRLAARRVELPADAERNTLIGSWIVPLESAKSLKPSRRAPAETATMRSESGMLHLEHGGTGISCRPIDGTFPHWETLVPAEVSGETSHGVDGSYLASVEELAKSLGIGPVQTFWNGSGPACFNFASCANTIALIMPRRNGADAAWRKPGWIAA
jgi:hypothetical protein